MPKTEIIELENGDLKLIDNRIAVAQPDENGKPPSRNMFIVGNQVFFSEIVLKKILSKKKIHIYNEPFNKVKTTPGLKLLIEMMESIGYIFHHVYDFKRKNVENFSIEDIIKNINEVTNRSISCNINKQNVISVDIDNSQGDSIFLQNINKAFTFYMFFLMKKNISSIINFKKNISERHLNTINEKIEMFDNIKKVTNLNNYDSREMFFLSERATEDYYLNIKPLPRKDDYEKNRYTRVDDPIQKNIAKKHANFQCEANPHHITFISKANNLPFVEGHHLIPQQFRKKFENEIDVATNIVALCPNCHQKIHSAINNQRKEILTLLFTSKKELLKKSGINITYDELLKIYGCF